MIEGEIPHRVGRIICLDCGLQTLSVPTDGTYGVEFELEDFARMWNLRTGERQIDVDCAFEGSTDGLLDEMAAGMAHMIIRIADDLPVVDDIHESLARVMASRMIDIVIGEMDLRAKDKPAEA